MYLIIISLFLLSLVLFLTKKKQPIIISIEGNIGSGKTKLINNLKIKYEFNKNVKFMDNSYKQLFHLKDDNNKNLIDYFLEDKLKYSYILQNFLFIIKTKNLINMIKDNFMAAPTFVGFIIMVIIAKAWMYTLSWFLIGLILSKKRYK